MSPDDGTALEIKVDGQYVRRSNLALEIGAPQVPVQRGGRRLRGRVRRAGCIVDLRLRLDDSAEIALLDIFLLQCGDKRQGVPVRRRGDELGAQQPQRYCRRLLLS